MRIADRDPGVQISIPYREYLRQVELELTQTPAPDRAAEAGNRGRTHPGAGRDVVCVGMDGEVQIRQHEVRNALLTIVSAFGFTIAALISEAVVTETVFSLPGVGRMVVQSILRRDYPVIRGAILMIVLLYLVINLVVDVLYAWLDPRVKLE